VAARTVMFGYRRIRDRESGIGKFGCAISSRVVSGVRWR
jgi:hypothetical protein